jgi:hypothetical protein
MSAGPALAHADSPASPPLRPSPLRLQHRTPAEIVALFARERRPAFPGDAVSRAARPDGAESLVPYGVEAVLRGAEPDQVILVGMEGVAEVRDCIRMLDVPVETTGPGRAKVVLTLSRAGAVQVRGQVLRLPDAGSAVVKGAQLALEGKPAWLHRALRQVIRAELGQPETTGLPPQR